MRHHVVAAALALCCAPAFADIYKLVDEDGRVTFTNIYVKGAIRLDVDDAPSAKAPPAARPATRQSRAATPAAFPKVDPATQRQRDDIRRRVLEQELSSEMRLLDSARRSLAQGEAVQMPGEQDYPQQFQQRVSALRETVSLHEKNVSAIQQELGNLRP